LPETRRYVDDVGPRRNGVRHTATASVAATVLVVLASAACGGGAGSGAATGAGDAGAGSRTALNQRLTAAVRPQLKEAYIAFMRASSPDHDANLTSADVDGPVVGRTYYAYVPSTHTYWAVAYFQPTAAVRSQQQQVAFQDEGSSGFFEQRPGRSWVMLRHANGAGPWPCQGDLPANLMKAWDLSINGSCEVADSGPMAPGITSGWVNGGLPDGTYFGEVAEAQVDWDGSGSVYFEPENWSSPSRAPTSPNHAVTYLSFSPAAAVEYSVGHDPASSHVVDEKWNLAFSRRLIADVHSFRSHPYYGFVVTVAKQAITSIKEIGAVSPSPAPDYSVPPDPGA
jgi:hypothetical protein